MSGQPVGGPAGHHHHAVGEENGFLDAVRDEHDRGAHLAVDAGQFGLQLGPGQRVQGAERLVHQQHRGLVGEHPGDGHPLLHAAGELVRELVREPGQPHHIKELGGPGLDLGGGQALLLGAVADVLPHREPGKQAVVLEHDTAVRARSGHGGVAQPDTALRGGFEAGEDAQQRALAAAAGSDNGDEFAGGNVQVDVSHREDAFAVLFAQAVDGDGAGGGGGRCGGQGAHGGSFRAGCRPVRAVQLRDRVRSAAVARRRA